ncbi:predicted protein [Uncinocarpus reesii 1704]|uniref:Amine oxidase domain-containing protein n=1 Tax=Uncinocarpus reesii (strain UAMH 1704) TaxID=336963 RepID=C4JFS2_UNCRE|nr:uncharacterized protein UREG_02406 [Uncinocarpus reesii 1704]EEP77557.1 predicted protein [Uncinocarpus reesii 1704]
MWGAEGPMILISVSVDRFCGDLLQNSDRHEITGSQAALRLRDMNRSMIVIEQEDILGGHTNTHIDSSAKGPANFGVKVFDDVDITREYFKRLGVPFQKTHLEGGEGDKLYADFRTGEFIDYKPPNMTMALASYAQQAAKYPQLQKGFFFREPVPEDLLLPFAEFIKKYNIGDAIEIIYTYCQGFGDLLKRLTLYVFKTFDLTVLRDLQNGYLIPTSGDNHEVYDKAFEIIKSDVLFRSRVERVHRGLDYVTVVVNTASGTRIIRARKLLVSIAPTLDNLGGFDLDMEEESIFKHFKTTGYYTSVVKVPGLRKFDSLTNFNPNTAYNLPKLPGIYWVTPTAPDKYDIKYGSPRALGDDYVKADIIRTMKRFQAPGSEEPEIVAWSSHTPFGATVSRDAIKSGFYERLYSLQGRRNTYYTGAAFHAHNSGLLWRFTEEVLQEMMK